MNIYFYIILSALVVSFLIDIISDYLNLSWLGKPLPEEFRTVYSEENYRKSMDYTKTNTKFGFISAVFDLLVMLIFWFSGGFNYLYKLTLTISDHYILQGFFFISILMIGNYILSLPFSIYSIFVIEEKYGFNKTTGKTFILDQLKSLLLSVLIGFPVLALVLYILQNFGSVAWIYGWLSLVLIGLIMQYIAPRWILPLFNKFKPLEDGELKGAIMDYATSVNYSLKNVFIMDGSKRSSKSNAFFTGFGKNKRIALFDTLIEKHTVKEIVSILAHEIGHYKKRHIQTGMIISFLQAGLMFFILSVFISDRELFRAFFMDGTPVYAGLLFFAMLYSPLDYLLSIIMNILSRKNEYSADKFAVLTTNDKESFISALKKLSENNLSNLTPHPFLVFISYSHPTVLQRIEEIRKI